MIEVGTGFHPELSGRENVYLAAAIMGLSPQEVRPYFDDIVEFSGLSTYLDTPVKRFSSGMFIRLASSIALILPIDILLFDETISIVDADFREKMISYLKDEISQDVAAIIVSHDQHLLERFCSKTVHF